MLDYKYIQERESPFKTNITALAKKIERKNKKASTLDGCKEEYIKVAKIVNTFR